MKKTTCIQLVLITAALASCDRPMYQRGSYVETEDLPDSTNSCPLVQYDLPPDYYIWYAGLQPDYFYFGDGFSLGGYYGYRYPATIARAGFGRIGGSGHS
jgi:hypothetical protein